MEPVQQASTSFFLPLYAAYFAALIGWFLVVRVRPGIWPRAKLLVTDRKWLDLILVFVAAAAIFGISTLHRKGLLLPEPQGLAGIAVWNVNILLIYSPLFIVPILRRQGLDTLFLSGERFLVKCAVGIALGILSVIVFSAARMELSSLPEIAGRCVDPTRFAKYFLPVFLEGVVLAFLFVRLRWALGLWPSLLIPAVLFSLGHVPNSLEAGRSAGYIATFLILNSALVVAILYGVQRSRDIIWIGLVHYLMDVAIETF